MDSASGDSREDGTVVVGTRSGQISVFRSFVRLLIELNVGSENEVQLRRLRTSHQK